MDYHVLNSTKRKKSLFIIFLPNTQNRFFVISKHNNQIIRLKTQSQTPSTKQMFRNNHICTQDFYI
ncbi:hypothetical protein Hanom_Chr10g00937211 [Helianthus anomalus]